MSTTARRNRRGGRDMAALLSDFGHDLPTTPAPATTSGSALTGPGHRVDEGRTGERDRHVVPGTHGGSGHTAPQARPHRPSVDSAGFDGHGRG